MSSRRIGYALHTTANAAASSTVLPQGPVQTQTPVQTNSLVRASGWIGAGPAYSMDLVPGAGAAPPPGSPMNWQGYTGTQFGAGPTYPPLPTPFGPDSRTVAPGGAVFPSGDYAGTFTDPVTGVKYAAFTRGMPDPIIPAGGDMAAGPCPGSSSVANRMLETLTGRSALTVQPCRQDMPRDWSEALAGTSVPAPLLNQQVLAAQGAQAARDTFFVRKDTPAGFNDTHWDGYIGTTNTLRVLQDTQTVKEYDGGGTSSLPFRPNPDFSLAAPMYHDGTHFGGPRAPVVTVLAEDKPAPPGRPVADALEDLRGAVRMDAAVDSLRPARVDVTTRPGNQMATMADWGWGSVAPAPQTPDGPARDEGLGVLRALAALDARFTPPALSLPMADDGRGGRHATHDALRVAQLVAPGRVTQSLEATPDSLRADFEAPPMPVRVGAHALAGAGMGATPALPALPTGPRSTHDHGTPSFRAGVTDVATGSPVPLPALAGDGRVFSGMDASTTRVAVQTAPGQAASLPFVTDHAGSHLAADLPNPAFQGRVATLPSSMSGATVMALPVVDASSAHHDLMAPAFQGRVASGALAQAGSQTALPAASDSSGRRMAQDLVQPSFQGRVGDTTTRMGPAPPDSPAMDTAGRHLAADGVQPAFQARVGDAVRVPTAQPLPAAVDQGNTQRALPNTLRVQGAEWAQWGADARAALPVLTAVPRGPLDDAQRVTMGAGVVPHANGAALPTATDTVGRAVVHDTAGRLATRQPDWNDWHGMVYGRPGDPAYFTDASTKTWDGGLGVQEVRGVGTLAYANLPSAQEAASKLLASHDALRVGPADLSWGGAVQPAPALDTAGQAPVSTAGLLQTRAGVLTRDVQDLGAGALPDGGRAVRVSHDGVRVGAPNMATADAVAPGAPLLAGPGRANDAPGAFRVSHAGGVLPQAGVPPLPGALPGSGGQWDGGLGAQRAGMVQAPGQVTAAAPHPMLGSGPGMWDGGLGAQRAVPMVGPQGQQGQAALPGPGQWDGAVGAQRPVANAAFFMGAGTQDAPVTDAGRSAARFLGAGAGTSVPRTKSLFWTEGVGAYATMPLFPNKPVEDKASDSADKHLQHLSLLREVMLAAHPPTGPDVRVKAQPGPVTVAAQTAAAADCLLAQRHHTTGALLNAAMATQSQLPRGTMDLVDVGYESDV